jgi:hypothetical protein
MWFLIIMVGGLLHGIVTLRSPTKIPDLMCEMFNENLRVIVAHHRSLLEKSDKEEVV